MKILSAHEMRSLDEKYMSDFGISQEVLMENAALAAYYLLRDRGLTSKNTIIFCGPGNNGGDGLALARKIYSQNKNLRVFLTSDPRGYRGASLTNYRTLHIMGAPVSVLKEDLIPEIREHLSEDSVIIDALLGTGLTSEVTGIIGEIISLINASPGRVISLDIPSGLSSDTGLPLGRAVRSCCTVSFGFPKYGHFIGLGRLYVPRLIHCNISIDEVLVSEAGVSLSIPEKLAPRDPVGHKGSFGRALFISGSDSYLGAPCFNSASFIQCGGGYSILASTREVIRSAVAFTRELVLHPCTSTSSGAVSEENLEDLLLLGEKADITAIGSGISLDPSTEKLTRNFIGSFAGDLIIDGDALTILSRRLDLLNDRSGLSILTPHIGEFSRLTGRSIEEISSDRINILKDFAVRHSCYVVLKDASTLIASPEGEILINPTGNSGLGVAGSGDILVGVIAAALTSLRLPPMEGLSLAVFLHGMAGDMVRDCLGEEGVTPARLLEELPPALKRLRKEYLEVVSLYTPEFY